MTLSVPSYPPNAEKIFNGFCEDVNHLIGEYVSKNILGYTSLDFIGTLRKSLETRAQEIKGTFELSYTTRKVNALSLKMDVFIKTKIIKLTQQTIFTEIYLYEIPDFIDAVEGFYHKARLENRAEQESLDIALGLGILRTVMSISFDTETQNSEQLQDVFGKYPELKKYVSPISGKLVLSSIGYLRKDQNGNPEERYDRKELVDWIASRGIDPVDGTRKESKDIKFDFSGREEVRTKLLSYFCPTLDPGQKIGESEEMKFLRSQIFLLALAAGLPSAKRAILKRWDNFVDLKGAFKAEDSILEMGRLASRKISRFIFLVDGLDGLERIGAACFSFIKRFIRQAELQLSQENKLEVREQLQHRVNSLVRFSSELEKVLMPDESKLELFKKGGVEIEKGALSEETVKMVEFLMKVPSEMDQAQIPDDLRRLVLKKSVLDVERGFVSEEVMKMMEFFKESSSNLDQAQIPDDLKHAVFKKGIEDIEWKVPLEEVMKIVRLLEKISSALEVAQIPEDLRQVVFKKGIVDVERGTVLAEVMNTVRFLESLSSELEKAQIPGDLKRMVFERGIEALDQDVFFKGVMKMLKFLKEISSALEPAQIPCNLNWIVFESGITNAEQKDFSKVTEEMVKSIKEISSQLDCVQISYELKQLVFNKVASDIFGRISLDEVMRPIRSLEKEIEVRKTFPNCLIGEMEWSVLLGEVEGIPLPEGMLGILSENCPFTRDRKIGETHLLVLVPSKVNGHPLTLHDLGKLIASKGCFNAGNGYRMVYDPILLEYGNRPSDRSHWVLMSKSVIDKGLKPKQMPSNYEVPSLLDVATCMFMNYLVPKEDPFIFSTSYTFCEERLKEMPIIVGRFSEEGFYVGLSTAAEGKDTGVAVLRRFLM